VGAKYEWDLVTLNGYSGQITLDSFVDTTMRVKITLLKTTSTSPITRTAQDWEDGLKAEDTILFEVREDGKRYGYTEPPNWTTLPNPMIYGNLRMGVQYAGKFVEYRTDGVNPRGYMIVDFTHDYPPIDPLNPITLNWQFIVGYRAHTETYDYIQFNDKFLFTEMADKPTLQFGTVPSGVGVGTGSILPFRLE